MLNNRVDCARTWRRTRDDVRYRQICLMQVAAEEISIPCASRICLPHVKEFERRDVAAIRLLIPYFDALDLVLLQVLHYFLKRVFRGVSQNLTQAVCTARAIRRKPC